MGSTPVAKLFYGYIQKPGEYGELGDYDNDWGNVPLLNRDSPCDVEFYGYDGNVGHAIVIAKSVVIAEWSETALIESDWLAVKPEWESQLRDFAQQYQIDLTNLVLGWHLVCLYF